MLNSLAENKDIAQAGRFQVEQRLLVLCTWWPVPLSGI